MGHFSQFVARRVEQPAVNAPAPAPCMANAPLGQFGGKAGGCHHHRPAGAVKALHDRPEAFGADAGAHRGIFGKAGVERGGEWHPARFAPAARAPPNWPFGGDVDNVGGKAIQHPPRRKTRRHRQPDRRIARHRHGKEPLRGDEFHLITAPVEFGHGGGKGAHHAVDLRIPRIGDNGDFQGRNPVCNGSGSGDVGQRVHATVSSSMASFTAGAWPSPDPRISAAQSMMLIAP